MPFKSNKQALWMMINEPTLFEEWKKKYGLPSGFNDYLKKVNKGKKSGSNK